LLSVKSSGAPAIGAPGTPGTTPSAKPPKSK
jgi:hypothetical protein